METLMTRKGNDSLRTHGRMLAIEGKTPQAAKNTPKYRIPTDVQVAQRMYPTPPTNDKAAIVNPRCWMRSATQVVAIVARNEAKNGGAVSPWALMDVKPISLRMVGRNTGRDEKLTLQLKYIN
jgi:hypothetical protein